METLCRFLANGTYITGETPSIADLLCASELWQMRAFGYDLNQHPKIMTWLLKMLMVPGFR
jgi:glutathione S-transferase